MKKAVSIASASLLLAAGGTVAFGATTASAAPTITTKAAKAGKKCPKKGKVKTTSAGKLKCVKKNGKLQWKKVSQKSSYYDGMQLPAAIALPIVNGG